MTAILSIARKELRGLLHSQVAVLFLALFLLVTQFTFFVASHFFARGIADLTPLFEWLPLTLIALVSAVAMRAWAEERRTGTLEVLLTLPIRTADLVLGKFVAGMALVTAALAATFPLALTVALVGPLDWGPVLGGYLGALLLGSTYLSLGLCISALTDNQVVALMGTAVLGGLLYLVGTPEVLALLDISQAQVLGLFGTGSRFSSIARGVVDLRDIVYYASLTTFFLVLNGAVLAQRRIDPSGAGRARRLGLIALVTLVGLNSAAANLWLHPVRAARIDLTENRDYTISDVTEDILAGLEEPLFITGVFSERSHPRLQPLVPQLTAVLEEVANAGGDKVTVDLLDPSSDTDTANLIEEEYGIRPVAMSVADRNESRTVNSWFHVLLKYGDQYEVLPYSAFIEVIRDQDTMAVRLRDPEYDLAKAIRRLSQDYATTESLSRALPPGSEVRLYASPHRLDTTNNRNLELMRKMGEAIAEANPFVDFVELDPTADPSLVDPIARDFGVEPALALSNSEPYYLHLVFVTPTRSQRIFPRGALTRLDLRSTVDATMKRLVPGQLKRIGLLTETPVAPPPKPGEDPEPAPPPDYRSLAKTLEQRFDVVTELDLSNGKVPDTLDVLIIGKPGTLSIEEQVAIDSFLLRGGAVIALAGQRVDVVRGKFIATSDGAAYPQLLARYGAQVRPTFALDVQAGVLSFPIKRRMQQFDYPFWLDIRPNQMAEEHLALAGLPHLSMPWASPVELKDVPDGIEADVLLTTTVRGWSSDIAPMPDFKAYPHTGFPAPRDQGVLPLAVALSGRFPSAFEGRERPDIPGSLTAPVAEGRLVVLGSSEVVGDVVLDHAQTPQGRLHVNNPMFLQNLIDWAVADTDLLAIRNAGSFDRALDPLEDGFAQSLELGNYLLGLFLVGLLAMMGRRRPPHGGDR